MKNHIYHGLILSVLVLLVVFQGNQTTFSQEGAVSTLIFYVK